MEIQDLNHLSDAPETFTPLKAQPFQIAEDQDEDILEKIPHGLTAKKNRRKSFQPGTSKVASFSYTPQRAPLTAPRPNVLNSRPIGFSPMNQTKRSLIDQLKAVKGGKENFSPVKTHFKTFDIENKATDSLLNLEATPSSPERSSNKRRSSPDEPQSNHKHQKTTHPQDLAVAADDDDDLLLIPEHPSSLFGDRTLDDQANENQEELKSDLNELNSDPVEPEELSRIEAFDLKEVESEVIPTQVDEVQIGISSKTPITPSRLTEPIAISPKTEQCSRVVDESGLLLDTSKSPIVDDSYAAPESPLSQHNNSIVDTNNKNVLESLDELDELPDDIVHEHSARISTPKSRPFFTIAQVHEIQEDFKKESSKLEETIKEKSVKILELNEEINSSKNKLFQLQDEIGTISLQKMQIKKENELLKTEFEVFKNDISDMELTIRAKEEKLGRHQLVITKFKERVKELNDTIKDKTIEIESLRKEKEGNSELEKEFKSRSDQYEKQIHHLSFTLEIDAKEKKSVQEQLNFLQQEITALEAEVKNLNNEKSELTGKLAAAEATIKEKEDMINGFSEKFNSGELNLRGLEQEKDLLVSQVNALTQNIELLNSQLNEKDAENHHLQDRLHQEIKRGILHQDVIYGTQAGISTLQNTIKELKAANNGNISLVNKLSTDLDEANEILTVRKAEVTELDLELKQAKTEIQNLQSLVEEKNYHINQLNETIAESSNALESKNSKLERLDDELQKQEGEHLAELESFHKEMSSVQSSLSSKSNELFKLREERDTLQREHDLLKYELSSLKEEFSDSDVRVSNLKMKINDSKARCQDLEDQVQKLKNERLSFEKETEKRLQQLAEDLYIQYSKKHEQKVQVLKKNYENKWQSKVNKAESENERLRREVEGLNTQLEREKAEKNEIIKLWDQFKENEGAGIAN